MYLLVQALFLALWPEFVHQNAPQFRIGFRRGNPEIKGEILAYLRHVVRRRHLAVHPVGVVHKERAFQRLGPDGLSQRGRLVFPGRNIKERCRRIEGAGIEHVGRVVNLLHEIVGRAPLDKDPTFQFLQQSVLILQFRKIPKERLYLGTRRGNQVRPAAARRVFSQFHDKPQRPVRNEYAVVVVRRIAHGQHALRQMGEPVGQQKILYEVMFHIHLPGKGQGRPRGKIRIAQPAGPFAMRAIHENIHRVLCEGGATRLENAVEFLIGALKCRAHRPGMFVTPQPRAGYGALPGHRHQFNHPHRVRFEGLQRILPFFKVKQQRVDASQAPPVHIRFRFRFIKGGYQAGRLVTHHS
ncbi:MAG: hypothetical protein BWY09_00316 [Candidatus Hydrogenedentes bacterium ADurb.Bin179]|nr:MAG: hypothetical protein BWY09_00316 [Candidatus Hydrogenedentes bacterium ADurb.Bin179]